MCGIVGTVRFDGRSVDAALLHRQVAMLRHRGPDGRGVWTDAGVGFGHARLAIIDRSDAGAQPMHAPDGMHVLTYNGELYNAAALRRAVRNRVAYRGYSDTEVLLHTLAERGVHGFAQLEGIFAFAWFERSSGRTWLVRDRVGVKPLYFHRNERRLLFASEIRPLLADPDTPRRPNHAALQRHVLFGYSPDPETAFDSIQRVPPAHAMRIEPDGRCVTASYWSIDELPARSEDDLWESLQSSVRAQLVSDVPTGLFLSGGLDSSLLLAAAAAGGPLPPDFRAYNVGVDEKEQQQHAASALERAGASSTAERLGVELVRLHPVRDVVGTVPDILASVEEPIANPSSVLIDLVCAAAKGRGTSVLLSGHGGDEVFGGYRRHVWTRWLGMLRAGGGMLAWAVKRFGNGIGARMAASLRRGESVHPLISIAAIGWDLVEDGTVQPAWFDPGDVTAAAAPLEVLLGRWHGRSYLKQMMLLDLHTYMGAQNLINMDKVSMRRSVEVRLPMLATDLMAIGLRADDGRLVTGRRGKSMLRAIASRQLPASLLHAPKLGFGPTQVTMMRGEEMRELLLGWRTLQRGIVDVRRVEARLRALRVGDEAAAVQLYGLAAIEQWYRLFIDHTSIEVAA